MSDNEIESHLIQSFSTCDFEDEENEWVSVEDKQRKLTSLIDTLKKETGKTSSEHLQRYLIDESKNILLNPAKTVSDVAYELGFEYPPYFSRLFKKKEGISPSGYRELYRMN